jgi:GT2 family glycosyltransferase
VCKVSVIIVNLNTSDLLRDCLQSVFSEAKALDLEVILVDNGSTDGSVAMVRGISPESASFVNAPNEGFAVPNNDGCARARGNPVPSEFGHGCLSGCSMGW